MSHCGIRIDDQLLLWTDDTNLDFASVKTIPDRVQDAPVYVQEKNEIFLNSTLEKGDYYDKPRFGGRSIEEDIVRRNQRVEQLIRQRSEANARGEETLFSLITLELERTYQVVIDEQRKTWRIVDTAGKAVESKPTQVEKATKYTSASFAGLLFGDESQQYISDTKYRQSKRSLPMDNQTYQQRIEELVQERIHLREEGRYLEADAIRRELWHTYVSIVE